MPLNPQTAALNDAFQAARVDAPPLTVEGIRETYAQLIAAVGTTERVSKVETVDVDGLDALLFTPPSCDDGLCVWFHGGGFVINSPQLAANEVDRLAVAGRCRVLSVDYRLCPEHPFPQSQLDAIASARFAIGHAADLGADPAKVAVGGDSAGGNLAAVTAQRVDGLRAQLLVYPAVDMRPTATYPHEHGYALDRTTMEFFTAAAGDHDLADPLVCPLLAGREVLATTPPALVVVAEYDPLRDQCRAYAAALRDAGVSATEAYFDDEMHLFFSLTEVLEGARRAVEVAGEFLRERFTA